MGVNCYYAFEHRYGSNMRDEQGDLIGTLYVFGSRKTRNEWVAEGALRPVERTIVGADYARRFRRNSTAVAYR